MTSKSSWSERPQPLLVQFLRQRVWLIALSALTFFFVYPVTAALKLQSFAQNSVNPADGPGLRDAIGQNILSGLFGVDNWGVRTALILLAFVAGCSLFRYLHHRRQVDFYHSQPIGRPRLYGLRLAAGALAVLGPYLVMLLAALAVTAVFGCGHLLDGGLLLQGVVFHGLCFAAIYATVALAGLLTGHVVIQNIMAAFLLLIGPLLARTVYDVMDCFYDSFAAGFYDPLSLMSSLSPLVRYCVEGAVKDFSFGTALALLAYIAAVLVCSLLLYRRRPLENAGRAWAFRWCRPLFKYPFLIVVTYYGGVLFSTISVAPDGLSFWLIFGFVISGLVAGRITEIVSDFDFNAIKLHLRGGLVFALLFAAVIAVPAFDLTHYDTYLPERQDIASARIGIAALKELGDDNDSLSLNNRDGLERCTVAGEAELDSVVLAAEAGIASRSTTEAELLPYDAQNQARSRVDVVYTLTNGRTVARSYDSVPRAALIHTVDTLLTSEEYRQQRLSLLASSSLAVASVTEIHTSGVETSFDYLAADKTARDTLNQRLTKALLADIDDAEAADYRQQPLSTIIFGQWEDNGTIVDYYAFSLPVFPGYERTLALLEEYCGPLTALPTADNVSHITVSGYDSATGEDRQDDLTERDEISEALEATAPWGVFDASFFWARAGDEYYQPFAKDATGGPLYCERYPALAIE